MGPLRSKSYSAARVINPTQRELKMIGGELLSQAPALPRSPSRLLLSNSDTGREALGAWGAWEWLRGRTRGAAIGENYAGARTLLSTLSRSQLGRPAVCGKRLQVCGSVSLATIATGDLQIVINPLNRQPAQYGRGYVRAARPPL